jgi:hypothetical protein
MNLPKPAEREEIHQRTYDFRGYRRADGLWDIEGVIKDAKTYGFDNNHRGRVEPGEPVHQMRVRLTLDESFEVVDCQGATEAGPFAVCPAITVNLPRMKGAKIGPGWRKEIRARIGGVEGCTHINEMLGAMATVAYQTMAPLLRRESPASADPKKRPPLIGTCHAFDPKGEIVRKTWPEWYEGDAPKPDKGTPL